MELIPPDDFFEWINLNGIGHDEQYPESNYIRYRSLPEYARFWQTPPGARQLPFFIDTMLSGLSHRHSCTLWPNEGYWPNVPKDGFGGIGLRVRNVILAGSGVVPGFRGAVRFAADERDKLISAIFAEVIFGWSLPDDLFIIPDHGRQFLRTDHHDVIHAIFSAEAQIEPFVKHMAAAKFPLPDEPPDWTFIKPPWME